MNKQKSNGLHFFLLYTCQIQKKKGNIRLISWELSKVYAMTLQYVVDIFFIYPFFF